MPEDDHEQRQQDAHDQRENHLHGHLHDLLFGALTSLRALLGRLGPQDVGDQDP